MKAANLVGSESCTVQDNGRQEDWQLPDWQRVEKCRNGLPAQRARDLGGEGVRGRQKKPECQRKRDLIRNQWKEWSKASYREHEIHRWGNTE